MFQILNNTGSKLRKATEELVRPLLGSSSVAIPQPPVIVPLPLLVPPGVSLVPDRLDRPDRRSTSVANDDMEIDEAPTPPEPVTSASSSNQHDSTYGSVASNDSLAGGALDAEATALMSSGSFAPQRQLTTIYQEEGELWEPGDGDAGAKVSRSDTVRSNSHDRYRPDDRTGRFLPSSEVRRAPVRKEADHYEPPPLRHGSRWSRDDYGLRRSPSQSSNDARNRSRSRSRSLSWDGDRGRMGKRREMRGPDHWDPGEERRVREKVFPGFVILAIYFCPFAFLFFFSFFLLYLSLSRV